MKISIFGLGYVGAVSGACLARMGHKIIGVDINPDKVAMLNDGQSPVVEELIGERTKEVASDGRLTATTDVEQAIRDTDISLISVGTPSAPDGMHEIQTVVETVRTIGETLRALGKDHTVVIRSTVPPGACEAILAPELEKASGKELGNGIHLAFNPEFLREGSSVRDFENPPFTIAGSLTEGGFQAVEEMYAGIDAPFIRVEIGVAESIKIFSNAFHAMKIAFANEVGAILKAAGTDARETMRIFSLDTQLNISPAYLRPGFAFGGSCLPKELRGISALANRHNVSIPLIDAVMQSNASHIERVLTSILRRPRGKIALFGISFKPGTDDLRESPLVILAERLIGKGYELSIIDHFVETSRLLGKNKAFIEKEIPHFQSLMKPNADAALEEADIIIIGHATKDDLNVIMSRHQGKAIIDLQGIAELETLPDVDYEGVCW